MINCIKCLLGNHQYYVLKKITKWSRKLGCKNCKKKFFMNDDCEILLPWDEDLENFYKEMENKI